MIVTVDGPAGAGKSTAARALARRLGFQFLDTGAMYRAVVWAALERGVALEHPEELAALARRVNIDLDGDHVLVDGRDVTQAIRHNEITVRVRFAADNVAVRGRLVELQREFGRRRDTVTEGRDQGTVAFPDAECKIFLTASPEERARRRVSDLAARGEHAAFEDILRQQNRRDREDQEREVGRLAPAAGAVEVITDGLPLAAVVDRLEDIVRKRLWQSARCSNA
jgi:cytidylate kinase